MGKGKGSPEGWVAVIRPGRILYEIKGVPEAIAREALASGFSQASHSDTVRIKAGCPMKASSFRDMTKDELLQKLNELRGSAIQP